MSSTVYSAQLSKMEVLTASPSTWSEIVQAEGWDGPGNELTLENITNLSSTGGADEFFPTSKAIGELNATLKYNPANAAHAFLRASNAAWPPVLESFKFTSSAAVPIVSTFQGYVSKFLPGHKTKTVATVALGIRPTGVLTTS